MKKLFCILLLPLFACGGPEQSAGTATETPDRFVERINRELAAVRMDQGTSEWVFSTYITHDTEILLSLAEQRLSAWHSNAVAESLKFAGQDMSPATARALHLLKLSTAAPAPNDAAKRKELAEITTELAGMYGAGKYCPDDGRPCMALGELEVILAKSRDYDENLDAWIGWRTISPPMRDKYRRFAQLANEGANELGFADLGEMWRAEYDMSPAEFEQEALRLYNQVKPLYDELHCYARSSLARYYGEDKVPLDAPIPAHLLGNMWSQTWDNIYDLLEPYPGVGDVDVDRTLAKENYTPQQMVKSAENFYLSLGFESLPETFWKRSQFSKPADRDVICHASAWGLDGGNDLRIKMCIKQSYEELRVIYHELGHNFYQRAYSHQPALFQDSAHGGFHEAIGDTVTLSMTPAYLKEVGLVESAEDSHEAIVNRQMQRALEGIALLPWAKLVDEWRWGVFSGAIAPGDYNKAWWELRTRYQGVAAPVERTEADFDPGAKYHVPGNTSYTRYFLARILQFQFQRALCDAAGFDGPLHACSVYGSKEAGAKLADMLEAGSSQPWQDTLEKLTGTRQMDGSAIIEYFTPLMGWLEQQNEGKTCGW
ncbi:MAG: M2 family metallopeptidase [Gammaproteobacteria bacterium]|nr:M2 family metallopeptidase [Gammaproteobacteria bacterium]MDH5501588.1 M2 family metallopeptidase [Gammaproteobacteria bacterium]